MNHNTISIMITQWYSQHAQQHKAALVYIDEQRQYQQRLNKEYVYNAQLNIISATRHLERAQRQGRSYLYLYIPKRFKTPYKRF